MFEKCGIKDIAYRLYMWRKFIVICSVIVAVLAAGIYFLGGSDNKDIQQQTAQEETETSKREVKRNYAYYYVSLDLEQEQDTLSYRRDQESYLASVYEQNMKLYPTMQSIYEEMLKKYSAKELSKGINKKLFAKQDADFISMYKNACQISIISNSVLELYVTADDKEVGQELLRVCREKLEAMQPEIAGSKLNYIGDFYSSKDIEQEAQEQEQLNAELTQTEDQQPVRGTKKAILLIIAWIVAVLAAATASAIFFPTINYDTDFELYDVNSMGCVSAKNASAFAIRLQHDFVTTGDRKIGLVTTRKDTAAFRRQCRNLTEQLGKLGITVQFAADGALTADDALCVTILSKPNEDGEVLKTMMQCDALYSMELAGRSLHSEFDKLTHFVFGMSGQIKDAILVK